MDNTEATCFVFHPREHWCFAVNSVPSWLVDMLVDLEKKADPDRITGNMTSMKCARKVHIACA